jgi:PAS domain S-box-containing protein
MIDKLDISTILSSIRDAFIMIDNSGRICLWNEAATHILGYTADEVIGKDLHKLIAPERYKGKYEKAFQAFKSTGEGAAINTTIELSAIRKDKIEVPIELSLSALKIEEKWCAIGVLRDISERKRAEQELQRVNAQLEDKVVERTNELCVINQKLRDKTKELDRLFLLIPDFLFSLDQQGTFRCVNQAFEKMLGYSSAKLIGRYFLHIIYPEDQLKMKENLINIRENKVSTSFCSRICCRDGHCRWIEWAMVSDEDGIYGAARDITDRKNAEDELGRKNIEVAAAIKKVEASWRQLNNAVKNIDAIIWQLDKNGVFTLYEGKVLERMARKSGQHVGLSIDELYKDYPEILRLMKRSLKGKACQIETKYQNLIIRIFSTPLIDIYGNVYGVVGITVDITKRHNWERRLKILQENHRRSADFNEILAGNYSEEKQSQRLSIYGIDCRKPVACYLIAVTSKNKAIEDLSNCKEDVMEWLVENGHIWNWNGRNGIGVLIQNCTSIVEQKAKALEIKENLEGQFPEITVRIGIASAEGILSLNRLYYKANAALLLSMGAKDDSKIFHYNDGGLYSIVPFLIDHLNVDDFINRYLGDIIKYEQDKGGDLLSTLDAILTYSNLKTVAAELHIHHNTVLWRKNKLEKILGYTIDDADTKLNLAAAIKLQKIREVMQRELYIS